MDLLEVQAFAREALDASSNGHIDVRVRQVMWSELGPPTPDRHLERGGTLSDAHRARTVLMNECLRTALDDWKSDAARASEPLLDDRDSPPTIVGRVDSWLSGKLAFDQLNRDAQRLQDLSFYFFELHEEYPKAELIASAATSVLWIAVYDQASDYDAEYREEDNEVFPADFMIAWLRAGCAPWDETGGPETAGRRASFWRWYIDELYPKCWSISRRD